MSRAIMNAAATKKQFYASPAFLNSSPPASALPIPKLFQRLVNVSPETKARVAAALLKEKTETSSTTATTKHATSTFREEDSAREKGRFEYCEACIAEQMARTTKEALARDARQASKGMGRCTQTQPIDIHETKAAIAHEKTEVIDPAPKAGRYTPSQKRPSSEGLQPSAAGNWQSTPALLTSQQPKLHNASPKTYRARYLATGTSLEKEQRIERNSWRATPARGAVQHTRYEAAATNTVDINHDYDRGSQTTNGDEGAMVLYGSKDGTLASEIALPTFSEDETLGGEEVEGQLMIEGKNRLMIGWNEPEDEACVCLE